MVLCIGAVTVWRDATVAWREPFGEQLAARADPNRAYPYARLARCSARRSEQRIQFLTRDSRLLLSLAPLVEMDAFGFESITLRAPIARIGPFEPPPWRAVGDEQPMEPGEVPFAVKMPPNPVRCRTNDLSYVLEGDPPAGRDDLQCLVSRLPSPPVRISCGHRAARSRLLLPVVRSGLNGEHGRRQRLTDSDRGDFHTEELDGLVRVTVQPVERSAMFRKKLREHPYDDRGINARCVRQTLAEMLVIRGLKLVLDDDFAAIGGCSENVKGERAD